MRHIIFLFAIVLSLLSIPNPLEGQVTLEQVKSNKDVSWAIEHTSNYRIEKDQEIKYDSYGHPVDTLSISFKTLKNDYYSEFEFAKDFDHYLSKKLLLLVESSKLEVRDISSETILDVQEIRKLDVMVDTVISYDPDTFEEFVNVVGYSIPFFDSFDFKQIWYYSRSCDCVNSIITEVIPRNYLGQPMYRIIMPIENPFDQNTQMNSAANVWIVENTTKLDLNTLQEDANRKSRRGLYKMLWTEVREKERVVYEPVQYEEVEYSDEYYRYLLEGSIDTVISYDPDTYEENIRIAIQEPYVYEDLEMLKVSQIIAFDKSNNCLYSKVLNITPMVGKYDENNKFRSYYPLYKIKQH